MHTFLQILARTLTHAHSNTHTPPQAHSHRHSCTHIPAQAYSHTLSQVQSYTCTLTYTYSHRQAYCLTHKDIYTCSYIGTLTQTLTDINVKNHTSLSHRYSETHAHIHKYKT